MELFPKLFLGGALVTPKFREWVSGEKNSRKVKTNFLYGRKTEANCRADLKTGF